MLLFNVFSFLCLSNFDVRFRGAIAFRWRRRWASHGAARFFSCILFTLHFALTYGAEVWTVHGGGVGKKAAGC